MTGEEFGRLILELAALKGIDPDYQDIWGQIHSIPLETQKRILSAMGLAVDDPEDLRKTLHEEKIKEWKSLTKSPLIFRSDALPRGLVFQFPLIHISNENVVPEDMEVHLRIFEENGRTRSHSYTTDQLTYKESQEIEGQVFIRGTLPFPEELALGVHKALLMVISGGRCWEQDLTLVVTPAEPFLPTALNGNNKKAGITFALAGLRSDQNWGIGDLGDLRGLVCWAVEALGADAVGLLPLHDLTNNEPYNISPYYPSSRFYRNPIYLKVPEIEEYALLPGEGQEKLSPREWAAIQSCRESDRVRFQEVWALKKQVLKRIFTFFLNQHWKPAGRETPRQKAFKTYIYREGRPLHQFALFNALRDYFLRENPEWSIWGQWPAPFQDPVSIEVRFFEETHWEELLFHKYLQWQIEEQLAAVHQQFKQSGARIGLYFDLALGIDPWGADAWAWRDFFIPGFRVGAPPDEYSPQGQEWGFYPPNQKRFREDGYRFLALEIRNNSRFGGALRIDHILQFARLFWIAEGESPKEGAYVRYAMEDCLKILSLESMRNKVVIIGEDLGTVPDYLREACFRYGIFSYRLLYFEKNGQGGFKSPDDYPEAALAAISTHDLPPLKGFWSLKDIRTKQDLGLYPDQEYFHKAIIGRIMDRRWIVESLYRNGFLSYEEALTLQAQNEPGLTPILHRAVLAYILSTRSKLAMISLEDLFGLEDQFNLPGTTVDYPNWSRKLPFCLEDLGKNNIREMAQIFRELVDRFRSRS